MKKIIRLILITIMAFALCACGSTPDKPKEESVQTKTKGKSENKKDYKQPAMKGEVNVNVYESSEWLETAAQMFMAKYPDMKVNIHTFYTGTDALVTENGSTSSMTSRPAGQKREDYTAQLNTQLLSGKADDIVITSVGLPLGRYVKMGVFEDLSWYLKSAKEINDSNYYMNIFDAYRTKSGALYQLPISATAIPLMNFDKKLIDQTGIGPAEGTSAITWREALDLGEKMYEASTLPNTFMPDARSIVGDLFTKSVVASINYDTGKIELDKEKMLGLLGVFKELENYKTVPEGFDFFNNECHTPYIVGYSPDVENALHAVRKELSPLQWKYDDGNVYLSPYYAYDFGITSQSKNKELAWEFLKFLISDEVQTLPSCPNAGVNKKGLQARVEGYANTEGCSAEETKEMISLVDGWVSQITAYRAEDTDLIQISEGVLNKFIDGNLSAEETIDQLTSRLEQYMNE